MIEKNRICIITDINNKVYGYGHFSRMQYLADKLKKYYSFTFSSINDNSEIFNIKTIESCRFEDINKLYPYLVIVDSREVDSKYIKELKKFTSVIIIDSIGEERKFADIVIEMLPNLDKSKEVNIPPFITTILNTNIKPTYNKDSSILVYLGFNKELKNKAIEIISKIENKNFIIVDNEKEENIEEYRNIKRVNFSKDIFKTSYSAVITYYGLTAFECIQAKIPTIILSPTEYHHQLAENIKNTFFNLGYYKDIDIENTTQKLEDFLINIENYEINSGTIIDTDKSIENFKVIIDNIKDFKNIECPFCNSYKIERKNRNLESNLYRCNECNALFRKYFLPPFTDYSSKYFIEDYKNQYGKTYEEDSENLTMLARRRLKIIKKLKPSGRLLDLGSAMGFFLNEARNNGYITEGIEISEYAANYCVKQLKLNVHNKSLLDFEYKEKRYDIITAWYVVEHIYNFENILEKILYSLKDDGLLILAMPNGFGISGKYNKNYFSIVPTDHAFETNPKSLDILLKKYSLERVYLENQSVYYNRFCDIFNLKYLNSNGFLKNVYNKISQKYNFGDTFECIYKKIK